MVVCARTGLSAPTTGHADGLCWQLLKQLAYIDDCEDQYTFTLRRHSDTDFGPLGASSMGDWFLNGWTSQSSGSAEVVAWYAELAAGFGWIAVPRASPDVWKRLIDAATVPGGLDGWLAERLIADLPERPWSSVDASTATPRSTTAVGSSSTRRKSDRRGTTAGRRCEASGFLAPAGCSTGPSSRARAPSCSHQRTTRRESARPAWSKRHDLLMAGVPVSGRGGRRFARRHRARGGGTSTPRYRPAPSLRSRQARR